MYHWRRKTSQDCSMGETCIGCPVVLWSNDILTFHPKHSIMCKEG